MKPQNLFLGIDIGSVSIGVAAVDSSLNLTQTAYRFHGGEIARTLAAMLGDFDISSVRAAVRTAATADIIKCTSVCDPHVAVMKAAALFHPEARSILTVGGERFSLIQFDENGEYRKTRANSACAAGTGSFLDQQARRLGLEDAAALCRLASANTGTIPKIASRCAVFAKTDLIHAQQEGRSLAEICDGLCYGLAKNIVDTLFAGEDVPGPVLLIGGVARNSAVVRHLGNLTGKAIIIDDRAHLYGTIGAALQAAEESPRQAVSSFKNASDLIISTQEPRQFFFEPLELRLSSYPEFGDGERFEYQPARIDATGPVEVELYRPVLSGEKCEVFLGLDIGSTSTKAVLLDGAGNVMAGLYTRTAGRPLSAAQGILESIDAVFSSRSCTLAFRGAGTTGSGRKFIGRIIGADLVLDEITAHARAAVQLKEDVDTIIEIGGQDAKFTVLSGGDVTFSIMNTVCAAGTGSFIEEQAQKLGCALSDFADRAHGMRAPIASDRCTVFMERDINHLLAAGYSVDEILATVLHSVRDNYLSKVAVEARIGNSLCFQGATARNRALVAAFEQKLGKPIFVSRYCHLTGALGVAIMLKKNPPVRSSFRGIQLHQLDIPLESERCDLCANHCTIRTALIAGETVAYGFLCGRDYETASYVDGNRSGFDLLRERKKAFSFRRSGKKRHNIVIGLPAALHLFEELPLWKRFFDILGFATIDSEAYSGALKEGGRLAGAEFCAPMSALHGHVAHIASKADCVFLPFYLEARERPKNARRQYCYYTQYSPALAADLGKRAGVPMLTPLIHHGGSFQNAAELYHALKNSMENGPSFYEVYAAYTRALEFYKAGLKRLVRSFQENAGTDDDVHVVLLGRPYTLLSPHMNKGIPNIFAGLGVRTFYQDMVPYTPGEVSRIEDLLSAFHWNYAARILELTEVLSRRRGLYPVLVTSFKCSPDSFVIEYFKRILDERGKPYLILQIDEHDSNVGYETRIEAALRSFRNHHAGDRRQPAPRSLPVVPRLDGDIRNKTLLIPSWDPLVNRFMTASLVRQGIDARLLHEDATILQKSLRHNTGQCIPLNAIAQECMEYVERNALDPAKTALWMITSEIACNIKMYPYYIKSILEAHGGGMEKIDIYRGDITFIEMGPGAAINMYFSYMLGGMLRRLGCRLRPYELDHGAADSAVERSASIIENSLLSGMDREKIIIDVADIFSRVRTHERTRPKVAIFGDIYVRDNDVMNQGLVRAIEDAGGEALTTPYSEYVRMVAAPYFRRWFMEGKYFDVIVNKTLLSIVNVLDRKYYRYFEDILGEPYPEYSQTAGQILANFNVKIQNTGESLENLIKVFSLIQHHDDIALFIHASPAFCCPGLVTEAMSARIEEVTGIPVVPIVYDGTGSVKNDIIVPYLKYPRTRTARQRTARIS